MSYLKAIGYGVVCLFVIAVLYVTYNAGYSKAENKARLEFTEFKLKSEQEYTALLKEKISRSLELTAKINAIEQERLNQLKEQEQSYETIIANLRTAKFSGVSKCPASQDNGAGQANNSAELICYTRSELLSRIKKTLAIGARADKLANDYNALLKMIMEYNHDEK